MKIGIDLIEISRFKTNLNQLKIKILSVEELSYSKLFSQNSLLEFVASRFAVKEAYFKASQNNVAFSRITYLNQLLIVNDNLLNDYSVSISHSKNHAVAVVLKLN